MGVNDRQPHALPANKVIDDARLDTLLHAALARVPDGFDPAVHYARVERLAGGTSRCMPLWLRSWQRLRLQLPSLVLGSACTLLAVFMWQMLDLPSKEAEFVPMGVESGETSVLQVRFRDDVTIAAVRASLQAAAAEVIGGPDAKGLWRVQVDGPTAADATKRLASDPSVIEVKPLH